jgi:hypothetical protein
MPSIPEDLQAHLSFDELYTCFGGKLVHWRDYITDYGNLTSPPQSATLIDLVDSKRRWKTPRCVSSRFLFFYCL